MGRRVWGVVLTSVVIVVAATGVYIGVTLTPLTSTTPPPPPLPPPSEQPDCPNTVGLWVYCVVTRVVDGDTLDIEDGRRIRLVLVDAPPLSAPGGPEARDYLADLCLGVLALIDEDDDQIGDDPFGRTLAVVHCEGTNANGAMIASGHAGTFDRFCSESEFGDEAWTGCSSSPPPPPPPPPEEDCDPSYPDVCIPSPPPDLDCADIPYSNFEVLPPDPHHFDGDGDGIGCES
jgi:micrococcal nuclease